MHRRQVGRAAALAAAAVLLMTGTAVADSVGADGDLLTAGVQISVNLGTVAPGATIERDVSMTLFCSGVRHVDPGQVVTVSQAGTTVPAEGGSIAATTTTVGPVPPEWANDTAGISGCAGPFTVTSAVPSHVTIVAPLVSGTGYAFSVSYGRSLAPAGVSDATSTTGFTIVTFSLDVADADTTPPTFDAAAANIETTTDDPAGTAVSFETPTASDDRDPNPAVTCDPPSGSTFPVGVTTVTCTATDASGNSADESFDVTVHLATVLWDDPVHATDVEATRGRSLPVKVRAWLDGVPLDGAASLVVTDCGTSGGDSASFNLVRQTDRWMTGLDTSTLSVGCHEVQLVVDAMVVGSFQLEVVAPPKTTTALGGTGHRPS